jgi:hypothetical protein
MKETTLTVNRKGGSYGFRRGNCYFTHADIGTYQRINAIRGKGITEACEEKIKSKHPNIEIIFKDDERRDQKNKGFRLHKAF